MRRPYFLAPLTLEDLSWWNDVLDEELLSRLKLAFASHDPTNIGYGIVDTADPTSATSTSGRPLAVSVNTSNVTTVDVNAGTAVFPSGEIVPLDSVMQQIPLANLAGNAKNVVFLYFQQQDSPETRLDRADVPIAIRTERLFDDASYVRVLDIRDYAVLSAEDLLRIVPLAVVSIEVTESAGNVLVVDMGTSVLPTNRPWFTAVDQKHRAAIGTGVVTPTNVHGLSINDITSASGKTLFQLELDYGMIVAKDVSMAKVPGTLCTETVLASAVLVDTTGNVTGVLNAWYMRLSRFPVRLLQATNAMANKDYGLGWVVGTPIVFFLPTETWDGENVVVKYSAVTAAEPPATANVIAVAVGQPASAEESVIAGGIGLTEFDQPTLTFEDAGQIALNYAVYANADGAVQRYPRTLLCQTKLATIGGALQTFALPFVGPCTIRLALTKAVSGPTLSVTIQLKGTLLDGTTTTENVTFGSTWAEPTLPANEELPAQFKFTTNTFASIESYVVLSRTDDGPNTELAMWCEITPVVTSSIADILPIADVFWDAFKIQRLRDTRPINTCLTLPSASKFSDGAKALAETTALFNAGSYVFTHWTEDFNQPQYIGTGWVETSGSSPPFKTTAMRKTEDGLGARSQYVSRAVPVRPHSNAPVALRFCPIDPGRGFALWVRFMLNDFTWSAWLTPTTGLTAPAYTVPLGAYGGAPFIKWQMAVQGECKGMAVVYLTATPPSPLSTALVWDVGAFDEGAYG